MKSNRAQTQFDLIRYGDLFRNLEFHSSLCPEPNCECERDRRHNQFGSHVSISSPATETLFGCCILDIYRCCSLLRS